MPGPLSWRDALGREVINSAALRDAHSVAPDSSCVFAAEGDGIVGFSAAPVGAVCAADFRRQRSSRQSTVSKAAAASAFAASATWVAHLAKLATLCTRDVG